MAKNVMAKANGDLESRLTMLERKTAALEQLSKRFTRKKREYTDEQRAAIRARLLAGQRAASKRRGDDIEIVTETKETKKVTNRKPAVPVKSS